MTCRTWIIFGATSIIAEQFAHLVAKKGHPVRLVGRDAPQLEIIAKDIQLRYKSECSIVSMNMAEPADKLLTVLEDVGGEFDLFIAHSDFTENNELNPTTITQLINVNILSTTLLIDHYLKIKQEQHNLLYLSSVAACRGRSKNSLYGATKAAVEVYLQGLQQASTSKQHITIARLGFIDTKQTYGAPGVFYAASPIACAKACLKSIERKKRRIYYPVFWRIIMEVIIYLPFFVFKKMKI